MAYDISKDPGPKPAAKRSDKKKNDGPKLLFALCALSAAGYFITAGQLGLFPFHTSPIEPAPPSESEQSLMKNAPTSPSQIPHLKEIEAMPEDKRPIKSGA